MSIDKIVKSRYTIKVTDNWILCINTQANTQFNLTGIRAVSRNPAICDKKFGAWGGSTALRG